MFYLNKVMVLGRLTGEPKIHNIGNSTVCDFNIAINRKIKDKEEACFIGVSVWGKQGEACEKYLSRGSVVYIEGRLVYEQWNGNNGEKRSSIKIQAESVGFVSMKERRGDDDDGNYDNNGNGGNYGGNYGGNRNNQTYRQNVPTAQQNTPNNSGHRFQPEDCSYPGNEDDGRELPPF